MHRDLKPANGEELTHEGCYCLEPSRRHGLTIRRFLPARAVLITEMVSAKITDFGSSRAKHAGGAMITTAGTPLFAAPEVMRGQHYDETADVFSFGVLLMSLAVGDVRPFFCSRWRADTAAEGGRGIVGGGGGSDEVALQAAVKAIWHGDWRAVSSSVGCRELPGAPRSVGALVERCCTHDPAARPDFKTVLLELTGPCAEEAVEHGPFAQWRRDSKRDSGGGGDGGDDPPQRATIAQFELMRQAFEAAEVCSVSSGSAGESGRGRSSSSGLKSVVVIGNDKQLSSRSSTVSISEAVRNAIAEQSGGDDDAWGPSAIGKALQRAVDCDEAAAREAAALEGGFTRGAREDPGV